MALSMLFLTTFAFAQADYTQQLLQNRRYEVRPTSKSAPTPMKRSPASEEDHAQAPSAAKEGPTADTTSKVSVSASSQTTVTNVAIVPTDAPAPPATIEPEFAEQLRSLYGDDHKRVLDFYEKRLEEHDPRRNKVEILVAPGWSYNESRSDYSPRDYHTSFPAMTVRANVWLTPAIGLSGGLRFSLGASLPGDSTIPSRDPVRYEQMELGLRFRAFQQYSRGSSSQEIGVFFLEDSTQVTPDSTTRSRLRSSGLGLGVWARRPSADGSSAWILGGGAAPRMVHAEDSTGWTGKSGSPLENVRLLGELGREEILSRRSQILYGFKWSAERNSFDGPATVADPVTGKTPTNVSVTNSTTTFFFGYRWGH